MIHNLADNNSLLNRYIAEIRDEEIQQDRMRFRKNLERIGQVFALEISKTFQYVERDVSTPLGIASVALPQNEVVLLTILRAGLPLHNGLLNFIDHAENGFISAYRLHHKDGTFEIKLEYITCPDLKDKTLILSDPMLATGASVEAALEAIEAYGKPLKTHVVTAIASRQGVQYINRLYPEVEIWAGSIDEELTAKSYIVPGLGDAGDLSFGSKLQE